MNHKEPADSRQCELIHTKLSLEEVKNYPSDLDSYLPFYI